MNKKFRLKSNVLEHYIDKNTSDNHLKYAKKPDGSLDNAIYETVNGDISSEDLINFLFPENKTPHIFISHSSKDVRLAIQLANQLYEKSGIISFIDSQIWNHIEIAINKMHKDYCRITNSTSYSYSKSNILLSNLYSLLSISLMHVMDRSDCVIFIESQNSIIDDINNKKSWNTGENLSSNQETYSPWIYTEINYANILRLKGHKDRETLLLEKVAKSESSIQANDSMPNFRHKINIDNFYTITLNSLLNADEAFNSSIEPIKNLDLFYKCIYEECN